MSRWLVVLGVCVGLSACGEAATRVVPPTAQQAQSPSLSPSPIAATLVATATSAPTMAQMNTATAVATGVVVTLTPIPVVASATPVPAATPTEIAAPPASPQGASSAERHYLFPVQGAEVQYGSSHHDYPATDIFCPVGSRFVAPTDGVIDYVTREDIWDPATDNPADRGGISLALVGSDGVRYYGSHLSEVAGGIEPGVRVASGQLLGLTGKSGNARTTPSHLHFGISHPTTPDDWQVRRGEISPYPYLRAWQQGKQVKPKV